jgi:SAM-dependent methyltransferase
MRSVLKMLDGSSQGDKVITMENAGNITVETYDRSAKALAEYFAGIGSRVEIIEEAIGFAGGDALKVVEVGCGDGRDAIDIVPRVGWYEGFDPSIGLIELARKRLPGTSFVVADALSYEYPADLDIIFGFASYLHLSREDFGTACGKAAAALRPGGLLVMTLKERSKYEEELVEDEFGQRMFYYYDDATVRKIVGGEFEVVRMLHQTLKRKTAKWLLVMLRKKA